MKLNHMKVGTSYGATIDGERYVFGWYDSGRAFIAKDDELLSYIEACRKFIPKGTYFLSKKFFLNRTYYNRSIDGIVRYLRDNYCR